MPVESMLQAMLDFAESDVSARLLRTAVVEADMIHAVETALAKDGDFRTGCRWKRDHSKVS